MSKASARLCTSSWHGAGRTHKFFLESALKRIHRTVEEQPQNWISTVLMSLIIVNLNVFFRGSNTNSNYNINTHFKRHTIKDRKKSFMG